MNNRLSDITVVVDRSGSMMTCANEAENGLNRLIDEQKEQEGECNFTLVQFDDQYEVVHDGISIQQVSRIKLEPRGMTALCDAVGKTINTIGSRLTNTSEEERPSLIMVVIVTDGQENASQEFKTCQVRDMIKHQEEKYGWKFVFLGANQDAFAEAQKYGINASCAANYSAHKTVETLTVLSGKMSDARHASMCGQQVNIDYTDKEREEIQ